MAGETAGRYRAEREQQRRRGARDPAVGAFEASERGVTLALSEDIGTMHARHGARAR